MTRIATSRCTTSFVAGAVAPRRKRCCGADENIVNERREMYLYLLREDGGSTSIKAVSC